MSVSDLSWADESRLGTSVVPEITGDPELARSILQMNGACILRGHEPIEADSVARVVLGDFLKAASVPAEVREDTKDEYRAYDHTMVLPGHTDGFAWGDEYPDYIFLLCIRQAAVGGSSFLLDGVRILEAVAKNDPALFSLLIEEQLVQTEPRKHHSIGPVARWIDGKQLMFRYNRFQRLQEHVEGDPVKADLLQRWHKLVNLLSQNAETFMMQDGDLLCVDNYRLLHGRLPFSGTDRLLSRTWAWSRRAVGVPENVAASHPRHVVAR